MDAFEPLSEHGEASSFISDPLSLHVALHKIQTTAISKIMSHVMNAPEDMALDTIIGIFDSQVKALRHRGQDDLGAFMKTFEGSMHLRIKVNWP